MQHPRRNPGYLLVELLAALTLAAIAMTALLPSVVSRSDGTLHAELVQQAIDLDRRARSASLANGPCAIRPTDEFGLFLIDRTGESLGRAGLPGGELHLLNKANSPLGQIRFDRLGRSPTYQLLIRSHGRSTVVTIDGVSGIAASVQNPEQMP